MLYTYILIATQGHRRKQKTKTCLVHHKIGLSYYTVSNSAIDPFSIEATYSLEHKQCYNIVIGKERYVYILQIRRDFLLLV